MAVLTTPPPGYAAHIAGMVVEEPGAEMGPFEVSRSSAGLAEFLHQRGWPGTNEAQTNWASRGRSEDAAETSGRTDSRPVSRKEQKTAAPSGQLQNTAV
jgi:hypothetical protein